MDRIRTGIAVALLAGLALAACTATNRPTTRQPGTSTAPATGTQATGTAPAQGKLYVAALRPVNRSGVMGEAIITVRGSTLYVQVRARGMEPGQEHAQHVHGFAGGQPSTCPPSASGTVVQEPEAETFYGPVLLPLAPFPTADASGSISYRGTLQASSDVSTITLLPLDGRAVVLHGMMVNGTYEPSVPVACGELRSMGGTSSPGGTTTTPGATTTPGTTGTGTEGSTEESGENPGSSAETP
jgi:Cu/Zn superoxide dismutase